MIIRIHPNALLAVALAKSEEIIRPYLCGVTFQNGRAIACDGRLMTIVDLPELEMGEGESLILPISEEIIRLCIHTPPINIMILSIRTGDELRHGFRNDDTYEGYQAPFTEICCEWGNGDVYDEEVEPIVGTPPDFDRVIPVVESKRQQGYISHEYMALIYATSRAIHVGYEFIKPITIRGDGEYEAHLVEYGVDWCRSVVMPLNICIPHERDKAFKLDKIKIPITKKIDLDDEIPF